MSYRVSTIIVDNFYDNPDEIRNIALDTTYYQPYLNDGTHGWYTSNYSYRPLYVREKFENIINSKIDIDHWKSGTNYNGKFHVKMENVGIGFHDHVEDNNFNAVGVDGWTAVLFLGKNIPITQNIQTVIPITDPPLMRGEGFPYDPYLGPYNSEKLKSKSIFLQEGYFKSDLAIGNIYNRLVLMRGNIWHSGASGFGDSIENGRMIQTFFFKSA